MSDRLKTMVFALCLCLVCSLLLTAASTQLSPYQQKNMETDRKKNILKSIGLIEGDKKYSAETVNRLYNENIYKFYVDQAGTITDQQDESQAEGSTFLPIYLSVDQNKNIRSYIIPIESKGLWGKIYGYLAVRKDGSTIDGFTVYKHSETPGLGGEIETKWFQQNFVGKKIVDVHNNFVSISVAKGRASEQIGSDQQMNYVDGISGATLTGSYLTRGLQDILSAYEPVSIRFRQNIMQCRVQEDIPWCKTSNEK